MTPSSSGGPAAPRASRLRRLFSGVRGLGLLIAAISTSLLAMEKAAITKTGHGGSKSAILPLLLGMGIAFTVDPNMRRPWIVVSLLIAGLVGAVLWFWCWG